MHSAKNGKEYDISRKWPTPHLQDTLQSWQRLQNLIQTGAVSIDGHTLDIPAVVALSRHGCKVSIDQNDGIYEQIDASLNTLQEYLAEGYFLYGVNTGFGGSADTRTKDLLGLQRALMQHTQTAIITSSDRAPGPGQQFFYAAMQISGDTQDIVPIIPLRGSISASGDLMPLSYVAGVLQGNPDVFVRVKTGKGVTRIMTAQQALKEAIIEPVVLGPKEGLSLINGTAPSAAVASLALHEAHQLAVVSQLLTALSSETLFANAEWAHPFIAAVRPHCGQIEAAQNVRMFLKGSKLTYGLEQTKDRFKSGLAQERYPLRSSPQWIGPQLEDLASAAKQLSVELNSTSDNPVVNVADQDIHCGANFQAASVTSSTEKTRLALQSIGKMIFAQTSEMINHDLNNGLPPNLAADDPSLSFCLKGIDVNTAAYQSELAFLANPVSNHVQSAEMHNQAVNSLALLSSRNTMQAVEVLSLMVANSIYTGCQGVDLRAMHISFLKQFEAPARDFLATVVTEDQQLQTTFPPFWRLLEDSWYTTASLDAAERCDRASEALVLALSSGVTSVPHLPIERAAGLRKRLSTMMLESYCRHRDTFFQAPITIAYLGEGTKMLYKFVREKLGVPMHRGLIEHPGPNDPQDNIIDGRPKKTIGSWVSTIYEAIRDGRLYDEVFRFVEEQGEEQHTTDERTKQVVSALRAEPTPAPALEVLN